MKKGRKAISAVLGTAIALVIVFTVFIPLILYLQGLQTIFMQEANRRLQYELERIHEKLEVHVLIAPPRGGVLNYQVYLWIYNPGILTVSISTIYIESKNKGIIEIPKGKEIMIAPGERRIERIEEFYFSPGDENDIIRAKLVTARGNGFISKETIGPRNLPYNLIITVSNMTFGHRYDVVVDASEYEYGCVLLPGQGGSGCGMIRRATLEPQSFNDTEGLVIFQVAPGNYHISLRDLTDNPDSGAQITYRNIEVYNDMVLNLLIPEIRWPEIAPLRINVIHRNLTLIVSEYEKREVVIPYLVSLGTIAEPLKDIKVEISCNGGSCGLYEIPKLYPGEAYLANFTLTFDYQPGTIEYYMRITRANGTLSGKSYEVFQKSSDQGTIKICIIERKKVVVEGGGVEEIQYARCP